MRGGTTSMAAQQQQSLTWHLHAVRVLAQGVKHVIGNDNQRIPQGFAVQHFTRQLQLDLRIIFGICGPRAIGRQGQLYSSRKVKEEEKQQ